MLPRWWCDLERIHYDDVIMGAMASQITSLTIVYSPEILFCIAEPVFSKLSDVLS